MFLAIINDTYAEVKSEIASSNSEFEIADFFKKVMGKNYNVHGYFCCSGACGEEGAIVWDSGGQNLYFQTLNI